VLGRVPGMANGHNCAGAQGGLAENRTGLSATVAKGFREVWGVNLRKAATARVALLAADILMAL
jgi:hypothetical protein